MLREICNAHKILLVLDEIYTGFNRAGRFFACEHSDVVPDLICLGKALTNGFPLSACVGRADIMDAWPRSTGEALHTSTFLGHPVGCAMALASIAEHSQPETATRARATGQLVRTALQDIPHSHLRGVGALIGLELTLPDGSPDPERASRVVVNGLQSGLILLSGGPAGNVLSFTPPFSLSASEAEFLSAAVRLHAGAN